MDLLLKLLRSAVIFCLVLNSCFAQQTDNRAVGFSSSVSGRVSFSGIANNDTTAGTGGMMYGPGLIGAFVTLTVQGVATSAARNMQKSKLQEDADKVLLKYADALEKFEYSQLMEQSAAEMVPNMRFSKDGTRFVNEWMLDVVPSFKMTQDESAIAVESLVSFYSPTNISKEKPDYTSIVKVWSTPELGTITSAFWSENNAERLKAMSAKLTRQSIQIALNDWLEKDKNLKPNHTTVRYLQGKLQSIERAQVLDTQCDRFIFRTLRNVLVSAPTANVNDPLACSKPLEPKRSDPAQPETTANSTKSNQ
jgi:hypothetical protein